MTQYRLDIPEAGLRRYVFEAHDDQDAQARAGALLREPHRMKSYRLYPGEGKQFLVFMENVDTLDPRCQPSPFLVDIVGNAECAPADCSYYEQAARNLMSVDAGPAQASLFG